MKLLTLSYFVDYKTPKHTGIFIVHCMQHQLLDYIYTQCINVVCIYIYIYSEYKLSHSVVYTSAHRPELIHSLTFVSRTLTCVALCCWSRLPTASLICVTPWWESLPSTWSWLATVSAKQDRWEFQPSLICVLWLDTENQVCVWSCEHVNTCGSGDDPV